MIDESEARSLAEVEIARWPTPSDPELEVVIWKVEQHFRAWILHLATRRWLRTQAFADRLVGACPIVVDRTTGTVHLYGSSPEQYEAFTSWLDAPG